LRQVNEETYVVGLKVELGKRNHAHHLQWELGKVVEAQGKASERSQAGQLGRKAECHI
jgi:hypothetical protein